MAHTDPHAHAMSPAVGHEGSEGDFPGARRILAVTALFLAAVFAFVYFVFVSWRARAVATDPPPSPVAAREGDRLPPLPRLQTTPNSDLEAFRASEDQVLTSYAWVDQEKGIVRLPIARAIELLAERGLPPAGPAPAASDAPAPPAPARP